MNEKINAICEKLNIDREALPDQLTSTLLIAIAKACGSDEEFPDGLYTTFLKSACVSKGIEVDKLEMPEMETCLVDTLYNKLFQPQRKARSYAKRK